MPFRTKRIYEHPHAEDGYRVLVDRLWPRGMSRTAAELDVWMKDVAPSTELREWFGHRTDRFDEFSERYCAELDTNPAVGELRELSATHGMVTLLYGAQHPTINHAVVLREYLLSRA